MLIFEMLKKKCLVFLILSIFGYNIIYAEEERLILITGCCYSGTDYMTRVLKRCGLDIGHEHIESDGSVAWPMATNTEIVAWGGSRWGFHFKHVFHQVRDPLKTITSIYVNSPQRFPNYMWERISPFIPEIHEKDPLLVKCAKYWYYWNLIVDKEAEWTYRIEDIDNIWEEFQNRLGLKLDREVMESIPRNINHKKEHPINFSWEDLRLALDDDLYKKIKNLAKHYGYTE